MNNIKYTITSVLALGFLAIISLDSPAIANNQDSPAQVAIKYLRDNPGGTLKGDNEVVYPDGSGFVAVDVGVMSLSECKANQFCMWESSNYSGKFHYVTGEIITRPIDRSVKSFWNNRSKVVRFYNNASTASICYAAGAKVASVSTSYQLSAKVFLSSATSC